MAKKTRKLSINTLLCLRDAVKKELDRLNPDIKFLIEQRIWDKDKEPELKLTVYNNLHNNLEFTQYPDLVTELHLFSGTFRPRNPYDMYKQISETVSRMIRKKFESRITEQLLFKEPEI